MCKGGLHMTQNLLQNKRFPNASRDVKGSSENSANYFI